MRTARASNLGCGRHPCLCKQQHRNPSELFTSPMHTKSKLGQYTNTMTKQTFYNKMEYRPRNRFNELIREKDSLISALLKRIALTSPQDGRYTMLQQQLQGIQEQISTLKQQRDTMLNDRNELLRYATEHAGNVVPVDALQYMIRGGRPPAPSAPNILEPIGAPEDTFNNVSGGSGTSVFSDGVLASDADIKQEAQEGEPEEAAPPPEEAPSTPYIKQEAPSTPYIKQETPSTPYIKQEAPPEEAPSTPYIKQEAPPRPPPPPPSIKREATVSIPAPSSMDLINELKQKLKNRKQIEISQELSPKIQAIKPKQIEENDFLKELKNKIKSRSDSEAEYRSDINGKIMRKYLQNEHGHKGHGRALPQGPGSTPQIRKMVKEHDAHFVEWLKKNVD